MTGREQGGALFIVVLPYSIAPDKINSIIQQ